MAVASFSFSAGIDRTISSRAWDRRLGDQCLSHYLQFKLNVQSNKEYQGKRLTQIPHADLTRLIVACTYSLQ